MPADRAHIRAFSYAAELAAADIALSTLVRCLESVRKIREHGIAKGPCVVRCKLGEVARADALIFMGMGSGAPPAANEGAAGGKKTQKKKGGPPCIVAVEEHKVRTGETLDGLAKSVGSTWKKVAKFNWGSDEPKKIKGTPYGPGLELRRQLLVAAGFPAELVAGRPPKGAAPDDLLDALACAAIARRIAAGLAEPFPKSFARDDYGLPIAIWA